MQLSLGAQDDDFIISMSNSRYRPHYVSRKEFLRIFYLRVSKKTPI